MSSINVLQVLNTGSDVAAKRVCVCVRACVCRDRCQNWKVSQCSVTVIELVLC